MLDLGATSQYLTHHMISHSSMLAAEKARLTTIFCSQLFHHVEQQN